MVIRYETIRIFFERQILIHINCGSKFYNGTILEVNDDKKYLILVDRKLGEIPILFEDIVDIEPYEVRV